MNPVSAQLDLMNKPLIMGVLNVTPDSFSGDGITDLELAVNRGLELIEDGADIIDIGGESSRPKASPLTAKEEITRVIPVIEKLRACSNIPISIDTYHHETAAEAIKAGASIINDITGLQDPSMVKLAAKTSVFVVIMHMQGTPDTMQANPTYSDVTSEVISFLKHRADVAVCQGIHPSKIILDPGIGFGKLLHHNLQLLHDITRIKTLAFPVLIGVSRKSFIGKVLNLDVKDRLEGTLAAVSFSAMQGIDIVRVHDVKEVKRCLSLLAVLIDPMKASIL